MKKELRNDFTDALNEEILSRKILDKTKTSDEENIFLSETKTESDNIMPEIKKYKPKKNKKPKKISVEEIELEPKISEPEIKPENDFEERIFAEADNDFYKEKISEINKQMRSKIEDKKNLAPIFHSKAFEKDINELEQEETPPQDTELYRKLTRAEMAGVTLSLLMLIYGFVNLDKPLFFISVSLLSHLLRPFVGGFFGKYNRAVQNAMRSFSLVLFFGAILFIFI